MRNDRRISVRKIHLVAGNKIDDPLFFRDEAQNPAGKLVFQSLSTENERNGVPFFSVLDDDRRIDGRAELILTVSPITVRLDSVIFQNACVFIRVFYARRNVFIRRKLKKIIADALKLRKDAGGFCTPVIGKRDCGFGVLQNGARKR